MSTGSQEGDSIKVASHSGLPVVEVEFPSGVAVKPCTVKLNGEDLTGYVKRIRLNVEAGDLVMIGLDIPCRLKLKAACIIKPEYVVDDETIDNPYRVRGGYAAEEQE